MNHSGELMSLRAEMEELQWRAAVVEAFMNGQSVEFTPRNCTNCWTLCPGPVWSWPTDDYRIAPEKKMRPFKVGEIRLLNQVKCKRSGSIFVITGCLDNGVLVGNIFFTHSDLLRLYTCVDGSPCGVIE